MKTVIKLFSILMLLMVGFLFLFYCPCQADWEKTTISQGGYYNSIAIDPSGHPHISYLDDSNPSNYILKHAYFDGNTWQNETVDSGDVGWWSAIAIDLLGHIHIIYHADKPSSSLKYAYFNGVSWNITTIDKGGYSTSLAVDNNNYPHISHIAGSEMKYIRYNGVNWITETIATNAFSYGSTSIAINPSGKAYISFSDYSLPRRQYLASNVSEAWEVHYLSDGRSSSLALDSSGNPHIVYYSEWTQELKYSYYDGSVWVTKATSLLAEFPHMALDSFNHPHVSFGGTCVDVECLIYTYFDGQDWIVQVLDTNNAGFDTSIALDQKGLPHISYRQAISEDNSLLNYMHFSEPDIPPPCSPVYRFWSDTYRHHFFTISESDKEYVIATWPDVWKYEGPVFCAFTTQVPGTSPVYRFWSNTFLGHFYTISEADKDFVIATWPDWTYEGPVFYAYTTQVPGTLPVYRFWSNAFLGHFYTISEYEKNYVIATWPETWTYEGPVFYAYPLE
jgi:hypothetical protein